MWLPGVAGGFQGGAVFQNGRWSAENEYDKE